MASRKHITIRPRVGSALEWFHDHKRSELAGLAHEWAEASKPKSISSTGGYEPKASEPKNKTKGE